MSMFRRVIDNLICEDKRVTKFLNLAIIFFYPAYLASSLNYNYIVVDWGLLSGNNAVFNNDMQMGALYTTVVMNSLLRVAKRVSKFIQFLDLDPSSVHIVGHSLG